MAKRRALLRLVASAPRRIAPRSAALPAPARVAVFLAIALCIVLHPLAAASPPDPSWIPGIYDAADFDDVVVRVALLASACDALRPPRLVPDAAVRDLVLPADPPSISRPLPPRAGRAPPIDRAV